MSRAASGRAALLAALTAMPMALAAMPARAEAQSQGGPDGRRMLALCTGKSTTGCDAYVLGFADAEATQPAKRFCVPRGIPGSALRDILVAYMKANPDRLSAPRPEITLTAFARAFPCGK